MALIAALPGDFELQKALEAALRPRHSVAVARSWGGLEALVRERPVATAVVDLAGAPVYPSSEKALAGLRALFPHLGLVVLVRPRGNPATLFRLGRAGVRDLVLLSVDELGLELARAVARAGEVGATSLVTRALSPYLPRREQWAVALAMDSVHRRWSADEFAEQVGFSRPFLSECFKAHGLPSVGHFLVWVRLFHAGHWLEEPGRTGESVARQLEYSSGAAFRRALRHYTGATPTQVREGGGLRLVLREFLTRRAFGRSGGTDRRVA